jgi:hypothetical protein
MKNKLLTAIILIVLTSVFVFGQAVKPRFVHEPDLKKMLPKFLNSQGFLDPKFAETVSKASLYYTDFYGIQVLKDTTKESIKRDFVPKCAEVTAEDENTITLKFKNGWTGKFYPNSMLKSFGIELKYDHVEVSGDTWTELQKNLSDFFAILKISKLEKRYLIPNPHYKDEQIVAKQLAKKPQPLQIKVAPLSEFQNETNAVLLYPEGVHGNLEGYNKLKTEVLDKQKFDWIGLEMLMPSQQKDLDIFINAPENSPEHLRTRKVFLDYFKDSWNGRSGPKVAPEKLYYFKILEQMRANKTRVLGVEKTSAEYIFFRYGENKFGAAVRSLWWAQALPKTGKGLIFGGSGHFTLGDGIDFQDFQAMLNPKMKMYSLQEIKTRKN